MNSTLADHPDRQRWNQKYREAGPEAFGEGPSDWLLAHRGLLEGQSRGAALDLACGNGRNAFFLAELGYTVDAVDISEVATEWVDGEARRRGLPVTAVQLNLETDGFPNTEYAVILNLNYLERSIFSRIKGSLAQQGLLVFETLTRDHTEKLGSKMNPAFTLDHNELLGPFGPPDFRVLHYREAIVFEQSYDKEKALASLVARKII